MPRKFQDILADLERAAQGKKLITFVCVEGHVSTEVFQFAKEDKNSTRMSCKKCGNSDCSTL